LKAISENLIYFAVYYIAQGA